MSTTRNLLVLLLFLFLFNPLFAQDVPSSDLRYDPNATAQSLGLKPYSPPEGVYPLFPWDRLPGWSKAYQNVEQSIKEIAECGFPICGFVQPEELPLCVKNGVKAFVGPFETNWENMTDEQIDTSIRDYVERAKQSGAYEAAIGFFIIDEPGTDKFASLGKAVAAVEKYAPDKLAYINLFPSYGSMDPADGSEPVVKSQLGARSFVEYLERYVQEVKPQFISYDNYMTEYSNDMYELRKRECYYDDLLEIRRVAQKYGLPFWNIVGSNRIQAKTPPPTLSRFAFQAYTSLAAGVQSVAWFTYYPNSFTYAPVDEEGEKTLLYDYLRDVNEQVRILGPMINQLESTGVFFSEPKPVADLPALPGRVVAELTSTASLTGEIPKKPSIMVGEFKGKDGSDWVMFVNLSLENSAHIRPKFVNEPTGLKVVSPKTGTIRDFKWDPQEGTWVMPGHGILLQLEK
ncbi:MAG: hypothetical protein ACRC10_02495 [Thermoguttaceae bacterium]